MVDGSYRKSFQHLLLIDDTQITIINIWEFYVVIWKIFASRVA